VAAPEAAGSGTKPASDDTTTAASAGNTRARYRRILRFAARNLIHIWWYDLFLPRIGLGRFSERGRTKRLTGFARRFHALAVELGGLMIKVGQFMSSRLDILPPEITKELEGLQDEVPPVAFDAIRVLAERELGMPLEAAFASIDPTPVAAASLGQAHRARLADQDKSDTGLDTVIVKVQRPGIDAIVDVDLAALRRVGGWLSRVRAVADRVNMRALIDEFAATSLEEVDYLHEAVGCARFADDFAHDPRVAVPEVVWERTTRRVLVLEDVTAIKITDAEALRAVGIDPAHVAPVFASVMFDQLFGNGYFHADPHPGNIFVTPAEDGMDATSAHPWKLTFIDFGMMGEVPDSTRSGLRKLLIAAASRDGKGLVNAMREVGVLLSTADTSELERAMTALFARFGGMGFAQLREVDEREFRDFAIQFGDVVRSLPFQLPEDFLLIIRAMSLTSGVCSALDPEFNLWDSIEPYATRLLRDEGGNMVHDLVKEAVSIAGVAVRLPKRLEALVSHLEDGTITIKTPDLDRRVARLERTARRLIGVVVFATLLIAGAVLLSTIPWFGTTLMILSVAPLVYTLVGGRRR
jgi:predicted unusual protein kinase regulating ubiquinone biosynthesis (AarF/ABC1/UbiB family)